MAGQLMPAGSPTTSPLPVPECRTLNVRSPGGGAAIFVKVATTSPFEAKSTTQVEDVPVHAPLQPPNVEPVVGVAVSVTELPSTNSLLQTLPQSMPAGLLVTTPLPLPALVTLTMRSRGRGAIGGLSCFDLADSDAPLNAVTSYSYEEPALTRSSVKLVLFAAATPMTSLGVASSP